MSDDVDVDCDDEQVVDDEMLDRKLHKRSRVVYKKAFNSLTAFIEPGLEPLTLTHPLTNDTLD